MMNRYQIKMSGIFYRNPRKLNFFLEVCSKCRTCLLNCNGGNDWTRTNILNSRLMLTNQLNYISISSLVWETQEGTKMQLWVHNNYGGNAKTRTWLSSSNFLKFTTSCWPQTHSHTTSSEGYIEFLLFFSWKRLYI